MKIQIRYLTIACLVMATTVTYVTRVDINLAVINMLNHTIPDELKEIKPLVCPANSVAPEAKSEQSTTLPPGNLTEKEELLPGDDPLDPLPDDDPLDPLHLRAKRYHWSQRVQGYILGAFFWAYILFHMVSGYLTQRYGGRMVITFGLLGSVFISFLTPIVTDSIFLIVMVRFLLGAFQAGIFPASFDIACKWSLKSERSVAFALMDVGSSLGSITTFYTSGPIAKDLGWPFLFFIPGVITMIVMIVVFFGVRSDPTEFPRHLISDEEFKNITMEEQSDVRQRRKIPVPWGKIISNRSILVAAFFRFSLTWGASLMSAKLPGYLDEILHVDPVDTGHIEGYMHIINMISLLTMGWFSEYVVQKGFLSRTRTRKVFSIICGPAAALTIAAIPWAGCDPSKVNIPIYFYAVLSGFYTGAIGPLASDMSKNFPAVTFALLNMTAMAANPVMLVYVGFILDLVEDKWWAWSIVFYSSFGLILFAHVFFILWVSAERQKFDHVGEEKGVEMDEESDHISYHSRGSCCSQLPLA